MTIEITAQEKQPLLGRTIIKAKAGFDGATPSREKLRRDLAKKAGVAEEGLIIKRIETHFGGNKATIEATSYEKLEDAKAVEHENLFAKHEKKEKAPAKEEAKAEEKKEEKAEKKEEAKAEEKKEA